MIYAEPLLASYIPVRTPIRVVLPAPLCPSRAKSSPYSTSKNTSLRACTSSADFIPKGYLE